MRDGGDGGGEAGGEDEEEDGDAEFDDWEGDGGAGGVLEAGMLRSLLVLGHLESVLNQFRGLALAQPHLAPRLAPVAVAAAWRLQRWDDLGGILGGGNDLAIASDEGLFEVSLARTLRAVARCRGGYVESGGGGCGGGGGGGGSGVGAAFHAEFAAAVRAAREQVMGVLAAASRESCVEKSTFEQTSIKTIK